MIAMAIAVIALIVVLTTVMIITLKLFDIIRTMTGGNFGTEVLANDMYSQAFVQFDNGRASALAVILFVGVLPLVGYNIVLLRRERQIRCAPPPTWVPRPPRVPSRRRRRCAARSARRWPRGWSSC